MQTDAQTCVGAGLLSSLGRGGTSHHQTGAGDDAVLVRFKDAAIGLGAEAEVVGINDKRAFSRHSELLHSLDEQTFALAIVQLYNLRPAAAGFLECAMMHDRESGFEQNLLDEIRRKDRSTEAVPGELNGEFRTESLHFLVWHGKVIAISGAKRINGFQQIRQDQPQGAARFQNSPQLAQRRNQLVVAELSECMNTDGIIEPIVWDWQPLADIRHDLNALAGFHI